MKSLILTQLSPLDSPLFDKLIEKKYDMGLKEASTAMKYTQHAAYIDMDPVSMTSNTIDNLTMPACLTY